MHALVQRLRRTFRSNESPNRLAANRLSLEQLESRLLLSVILGAPPEEYEPIPNYADNSTEEFENFLASGDKWPQPGGPGSSITVTYSYSNLTSLVSLTNSEIKTAVKESLGLWAGYAPLNFLEVKDSGPLPTSSHLSYSAINHPDIRFGKHYIIGEALAHTLSPDGSGLGGDVHFNSSKLWDINPNFTFLRGDFLETTAHEIGHSLGLGHEEINDAIMNPRAANRFDGFGTSYLLPDDISGIRDIYGRGRGSVDQLDFKVSNVWARLASNNQIVTSATHGEDVSFSFTVSRQNSAPMPEVPVRI